MKTHLTLFGAVTLVFFCASESRSGPETQDWPVYLGGKKRDLFSPLAQINRKNVKSLLPRERRSGSGIPDRRRPGAGASDNADWSTGKMNKAESGDS